MDKRIWKVLTFLGFLLGLVVMAAIVFLRFPFFPRYQNVVDSFDRSVKETQQFVVQQTQVFTQEQGAEASTYTDEDKKNLQRMTQSCFSDYDCISSIDAPQFVSVREGRKFLTDDDLVIGLAFDNWKTEDDPVKAYPIKILNWHEVVNDFLNENPVAVTYSPITFTPQVYQTLRDGGVVSMGVSNKLFNGNTVLYDRQTKSLWSQFDGECLVGSQRGQHLVLYPYVLMRWGDWVKQYPQTVVLAEPEDGLDYNSFPYHDYDKTDELLSSLENVDARRSPKEVVYGLNIDGKFKLYPELELQKALAVGGSFLDSFAGRSLKISYSKRFFSAEDTQAQQKIWSGVSYYFFWEAFSPNSDIYIAQEKIK